MSKSITRWELVQLMVSLHHNREEQRRKDEHVLNSAKAGVDSSHFGSVSLSSVPREKKKKDGKGNNLHFSGQYMNVLETISLKEWCLKPGHTPSLILKYGNVIKCNHPTLL